MISRWWLAAAVSLLSNAVAAADCVPVATWVVPSTHETRAAPAVLREAAGKRVVLLGEEHTSAEDHRWELQMLAALHALHPQLVIGFEMFPRRVQPALDRWVKGELTQEQFLEQSDWPKVWGMDPALYMPLFDFARMNHIPMIALDVDPGERAAAAPHPAPAQPGYVEMLKRAYAEHRPTNFDRFVEAQTRRDRIMASSIANALAAHPGALVVGIMGQGHVVHGYGVAHQLADLGTSQVELLLPWHRDDDCAELEDRVADAVFGVAAPVARQKPRLGVSLDPAQGGARVVAVQKGSIAERAGLKAGDVIVEVAGHEVDSPGVVGEALDNQAPGTWLPLEVRRGSEALELVAKFPTAFHQFTVKVDPRARRLEGETPQGQSWERSLDEGAQRGVFLPGSSDWYPSESDALAAYDVTVELPEGQVGLVPGTLVAESNDKNGYRARIVFPHPGEPIDLITGPYRIDERTHKSVDGRSIRLRTYFHPAISGLASGYLDSVEGYLDLFEREVGPYPFGQFSVVSSPTPTGYGMPTLTYLGIGVLKLPFIRSISLGHEVLHNWWGNGVYVDESGGNWAEGLTTFMADYAFKEKEGDEAARAARLGWLRDIAAVPPGRDKPLTQFRSRTHETSQIVGYRKAAMVLFMLREAIGEKAFYDALRKFWHDFRFRRASWSDLERAFESTSGTSLTVFFDQWLHRAGAPNVRLTQAKALDGAVRATLTQDSPPYTLRVPLVVEGAAGETRRVVELSKTEQTFDLKSAGAPREVLLDPELRVLRRLAPDEAPPILRNAIVAAAPTVLILDDSLDTPGLALAQALFERTPIGTEKNPALVMGSPDEVDAWLKKHGLTRPSRNGTAQAWMAGSTAVVSADNADALAALVRPLPHYGAESFVFFDGAKAIERGVWPSRPQRLSVER